MTPRLASALLTACLLTSCAISRPLQQSETLDVGPVVAKPTLPPPPPLFSKPVPLPTVKVGESVKVFALRNRAALMEANMRLKNDGAFYEDVKREFSQ